MRAHRVQGQRKKVWKRRQMERENAGKKEVLPIAYALFAGFVICIYCSNSLRVPMLILEKKLGTESEASIILTLMMLMGIAAGVYFGKLTMWWKEKLPGVGCLMLGAGMLLTAYAGSLPLIGIGISIVGFFYTVLVTYSFHQISEQIPQSSINTATSIVLVGCNLGSGVFAVCAEMGWEDSVRGVSVPFVGVCGDDGSIRNRSDSSHGKKEIIQ